MIEKSARRTGDEKIVQGYYERKTQLDGNVEYERRKRLHPGVNVNNRSRGILSRQNCPQGSNGGSISESRGEGSQPIGIFCDFLLTQAMDF